MKKTFYYVIEKDADGYYVGTVPELPGCHSQARTLGALTKRIKEAIRLYLEANKGAIPETEFVGVISIEIAL
jgi:predicted RNase H-like HicB family nuclease